ncbi:hypothetical protein M2323_001001 [Rhodoblastus acidophilus]|uniref:L,D-transpeptidase n=1 Tax=Rhodoblastus acidophilus TaxID=1074 RepID=UPI002224A4C4|nr:L,D-transpeptidase [Rhodoblastus acidophilus]MCW2283232.1 hypothetical protein [Rhodoblastus acidophilus]MCW2332092.1 hypothetical protein [Rhodoblastus acidophilus]
MRHGFAAVAFSMALIAAPAACEARVQITVDLSTQTMTVNGANASYSWPVSSARGGYVTPQGTYGVQSLQTMHYSKKYHNSPMPHSIFFHGGFAIHGTYDLANLGRPASHGCVRISPANAATLYALVQREGATIHIVGSPSNASYARAVEPDSAEPVSRTPVAAAPQRAPTRVAQNMPAPATIFGFAMAAPSEPAAAQTRARASH